MILLNWVIGWSSAFQAVPKGFESLIQLQILLRHGAVAARQVHTLKVGGASPPVRIRGISANGNTSVLHTEIKSSILLSSTIYYIDYDPWFLWAAAPLKRVR